MAEPGKTILLVEDEDNIALALAYLIERKGFTLSRASTGPEALAALSDARPDLVLLDVQLPGASGYEIVQHIRQDERLHDVKVLMMSASGGEKQRQKGLALGADRFFTKPFDTRELTDEIVSLLSDAPAHG